MKFSTPFFIAVLFLGLFFRASAQDVDRSDPIATVAAFTKAVEGRNFNDLVPFVDGASEDPRFGYDLDLLKAFGAIWKLDHLKVAETSSRTSVEGDLTIVYQGKPQPAVHQVVALHRVDGKWFVDPTPTYVPLGVPAGDPTHILADMAAICRYPTLFSRQGFSRLYVCLYNVRDLGGLVLASAKKDGGKLGHGSGDWVSFAAAAPNGKTLLRCPLDPNEGHYAFNEALVGKSLGDVKDPSATVLVYEGAGRKLNFRHFALAAVVFCDGHAKMIGADDGSKLLWDP